MMEFSDEQVESWAEEIESDEQYDREIDERYAESVAYYNDFQRSFNMWEV